MFCCDAPFLLPLCFSFGPLRAACALGAFLSAPPPPFLCAPLLCPSVVSGPGCPWPRRFVVASPALSLSLPLSLVSFVPLLSRRFRCFRPGVPWASTLCGCPPPSFLSSPPFFFGVLAVRQFPLLSALGLGTAWLSFFFFRRALCGACVVRWCCAPPPPGGCSWCFAVSRVLLCGVEVWSGFFCVGCVFWGVFLCCAVLVCGCCSASYAVVLCCWVYASCLPLALAALMLLVPCCALRFCVVFLRELVPSCVVVCCDAFFGVLWCQGALCHLVVWSSASCCVVLVVSGCPALSPPPACCCPCCCLVPCRGPLLCAVLGCGAVMFCCAACRALCCCLCHFLLCGALLPPLRLLVPCGVACCCWVLVAWSGCPLLSLGGVLCCWCSCLAAWPAALWCPVVCRGGPPLSAVSGGAVFPYAPVLCCPAVCVALLVVFVCFLSLCVRCCAGAPALCCSVPVWSVLFLVSCAVVCCCVLCGFLWHSVVRWCCSVVLCGVLWCPAVLCCVLWCCATLWCRAVRLCHAFSVAACGCCPFFLEKPLLSLSIFERSFEKKRNQNVSLYTTQRTHAGRL